MTRGQGPRGQDPQDPREVLQVAVELADADAEARAEREAAEEAARELGVEGHLAEAEHVVAQRRWLAEEAKARRGRWLRGGLVAAAIAGAGLFTWQAVQPDPGVPFSLAVAEAGAVILDASPGTLATLQLDGAQAEVTVTEVAPRPDGTWFVNLDRRDVPPLDGLSQLVVTLSGTLPQARVYLEAGSDERWRSGPIALGEAPTDHRLDLATFDHQRRGPDGRWKTVDGRAPTGVRVLSVKLGHFVNPPTATGWVRVGQVRAE
jgi:hypothetical protein